MFLTQFSTDTGIRFLCSHRARACAPLPSVYRLVETTKFVGKLPKIVGRAQIALEREVRVDWPLRAKNKSCAFIRVSVLEG